MRTVVACVFLPLFGYCVAPVWAGWSQWRGPERDGVSPEPGLLQEWPEGGPELLWTIEGLGRGLSSVAISGGRAYVMGGRGRTQVAAAYDLATRGEVWNVVVSEKEGEPRCTPTVAGGRVYALSTDGQLVCCRAEDGEELWRKSFAADFGVEGEPAWGFSESPLVDEERVVVVPGTKEHLAVALKADSGEVIWKTTGDLQGRGHDGAGYTGAVVSRGGGVKQYVTLVGKGAIGVAAEDGRLLWHYNNVANGTAVIPTPLVWDDYVFVSSGYGTGAALLELNQDGQGVRADERYFLESSTFQNHHGGMVRLGDHIYAGRGHNNGFPVCLAWKTGEIVWDQGRGPGQESAAVVAADGCLYFRYQDGVMALMAASPEAYELRGAFTPPHNDGPAWAHPAIDDGKLYLRSQDALMCYDIRR
ncbi:MAG TPA: PQQ-binding-like beta-propeller repeat protein [Verrucomicrobiales bacterium]|nr:PQQ-binding-like beta-propeller repeat protein [Verrucomicrobiales bacterium]